MFDRIAGHYDLMNGVMSAGLHHRWRNRAADLAQVGPGSSAIDVCCGTGDLALELARRTGDDGHVVGVDFAPRMLEIARRKSSEEPGKEHAKEYGKAGANVEWREGNALELPFADASFDAATVGFGVRNLADLERGISEMARVVRPGGRVVILEITTPRRPPLSWFYRVWFDRIVPLLGTLAGDRDAYTYLPASVRRFPPAPDLAAVMASLGLSEVRYLLLAGGIVAIHSATVVERSKDSNNLNDLTKAAKAGA